MKVVKLVNTSDVKDLLMGIDELPWEENVDDLVNSLPTVDAVEVVHAGKAVSAISKTGLMCTACYSDIDCDAVFCKYCGAKMDLERKDK